VTQHEDRVNRLVGRLSPGAAPIQPASEAIPAALPAERFTLYLPGDLAQKLDLEARRLNYEFGSVSRSRLAMELLKEGMEHLEVVGARLKDKGGSGEGRLRR